MKYIQRPALLVACFLLLAGFASAQSVDAFLGLNALLSGQGLVGNGAPKLGSGAFMNAGGDLMILPHNLGIGAEVAWRASQQNYGGLGARPILYDFNLVWQPVAPGSFLRPDFAIGFGGADMRFYTGSYTCTLLSGCTDYVSSKHFLLHAGVGLKMYITNHIFFRPAVDYYNIRHDYEYRVPDAWQVGVSIGYTLGSSSS